MIIGENKYKKIGSLKIYLLRLMKKFAIFNILQSL